MAALSGVLLAGWGAASGATAAGDAVPTAGFQPPAPGTYALQKIQRTPVATVLTTDGRALQLRQFTTGAVTLLGFMYTYCSDPVGCPLAYATFMAVRAHLLAHPVAGRRVRLVSLSFDPSHDTPDAMARYGGSFAAQSRGVHWYFLTTASTAQLRPIVDGLGQGVRVQRDPQGRPTRFYDHMLKVFLIDKQGWVREIYSTPFLLPAVVINDIDTLLAEDGKAAR